MFAPLIRKTPKILLGVAGLIAALLLAALLLLRGSLPLIEGEFELAGLRAPVKVERDAHGRAVITAANLSDLARALGFVHAQDRFFQMDMSRRSAAGELSEVLGRGPLELDRARRMHRLRSLARQRVASLTQDERALLEVYAAGVNAGLNGLHSRPFEYWLLGVRPAAWLPEDLLLVVYTMFFELTDELARRDAMLTAMSAVYPQEYFEFLAQDGSPWDAPVIGSAREPLPVPAPSEYTLPQTIGEEVAARAGSAAPRDEIAGPPLPGSNNWALHGSRTASGAALLANDMHLGLRLPNTWYHVRLVIRDPVTGEASLDATGVSLPGTFGVIVGSNGSIAWGFTNSYGDWSDRVLVDVDPDNPDRYRVADGFEAFSEFEETIAIKGADPVKETYRWTRWGPVLGEDHLGRLHALKWLAHEPEAVNSKIIEFSAVTGVTEALVLANQVGGPPQNFVVADRKGNIGWTIMGKIPRRSGYDPRMAASWAAAGVGWQGWLSPEEYPRLVNPPGGQIWTANARVTDGEWLRLIGDGGYDLGARAGQIRDSLRALDVASEPDMLAIQLDDRALFLARWRELLLAVLDDAALSQNASRAELRQLVANWKPRASTDSSGFRLVRAWRAFMLEDVFEALTIEAREADPSQSYFSNQWEGALWALLEAQPEHLLPPQFASWRDWMLHVVDVTTRYFLERYDGPLEQRVWGERNRVRVSHPLSRFVPLIGDWLDMPELPLPGDSNMPRVQSPGFGASQRLSVSPGREEAGYFHMPGGQSGHPLSPFYGVGHAAWAQGDPLPFLPGAAEYVLHLSAGG